MAKKTTGSTGTDSKNRTGITRPPMERMLAIHKAIQGNTLPNATTLATANNVSAKTIRRDLDFMRDRLDMPVEYDPIAHGYFYTEDVANFPTMQITEGELFAMLVAEKALQQYRGTTFEKPLVSAFKKMAESLPDTVSVNLQEWDQSISFRTSAVPLLDLETFDALAKSTSRKQQLEIHYRKPGSSGGEARVVDPYQLANINGEWFLFAFDHLRKDIRTFVPTRIQQFRPTGKSFERPKRFSIDSRLRDSFGVISGKTSQEVVIRFSSFAAEFIREKTWHPSQKLKELKSGELEIRLKLSSTIELQRWVLGWGGHATVVKPAEFATQIREEAKKILKNHI